jgi:hypothetical protein
MDTFLHTSQVDFFIPQVEVKKRLKKVVVSGRSRMPDPGEYFNDLANNLADYFTEFNRTLFIEFYFDYINTGSSKWLLFVMQYLQSLLKENKGIIEVTWKYDYDDETIQETGELLQAQISFPVMLKSI